MKHTNIQDYATVATEIMILADTGMQLDVINELKNRLTKKKTRDEISTKDLISIQESSFKRSQLLEGKATENINQNIKVTFTGLDD
jgi:hypothetical protein